MSYYIEMYPREVVLKQTLIVVVDCSYVNVLWPHKFKYTAFYIQLNYGKKILINLNHTEKFCKNIITLICSNLLNGDTLNYFLLHLK
jgi:hypothetical protein